MKDYHHSLYASLKDHNHSAEAHNLNLRIITSKGAQRESNPALMKNSEVSSDTSDDISMLQLGSETRELHPRAPLELGSGAVDHPQLDTVATAPIDEAASRQRERPCRGSLFHGNVNEDLPQSKKLSLDQQQRYHRRREKLLLP